MIMIVIGFVSNAQTTFVQGRVLSFKTFGLNNVEVKAKRSGSKVYTDSTGTFRISVKTPDILKVIANGFDRGTISIQSETEYAVNIIYQNNDWAYDQVMKNENMTKEDLDYAIKYLSGENNNYDHLPDIFAVIQSEYPPAKVDYLNGTKTIFLNARGATSVFAGQNALLVVDGIITQDISAISPAQVKDVKVIVGSEASLYGTRGANGVVEIYLKSE